MHFSLTQCLCSPLGFLSFLLSLTYTCPLLDLQIQHHKKTSCLRAAMWSCHTLPGVGVCAPVFALFIPHKAHLSVTMMLLECSLCLPVFGHIRSAAEHINTYPDVSWLALHQKNEISC